MAAAVTYCSVVPFTMPLAAVGTGSSPAMAGKMLLSPQTTFWTYIPMTAMMGGSATYVVAWVLAGMAGAMLGQYHVDNQNWLLATKEMIKEKFSLY